MISQRDIGWVAGLLEGDGHFGLRFKYGGRIPSISVQVQSVEKKVLEHLKLVTGIGRVFGPYILNNKNARPIWRWQTERQSDAAALMMTVYPLMWDDKQEAIEDALGAWRLWGQGIARLV